jgi:GAF domain-containing protein
VDSTSLNIAALLGDFALQMQAEPSSEATLHTIVRAAVDLLPGISWSGISLVRGKKVTSEAPSDEVARRLDQLQSELGEGPAFSALRDRRTIDIPDLRAEERWPKFVAAATGMGVHCLLSFRLFIKDGALGALNLYGPRPNTFDDESVAVGEILSQHAAVALADASMEEQLRAAIETRDVIGQAKGILMHRDHLTGLQAFATLTRASQETNIKLVDVARFLVAEFEKDMADTL